MWTYEQASGNLLDDAGTLAGVGYAGNGAAKNDPAQQCLKDHGPLPRGLYTILPALDPPNHLGPLAMPLVPDAGNQMCGRGDFLIHGDRIGDPGTASDGCIVMGPTIRQAIAASGDNRLQVVG